MEVVNLACIALQIPFSISKFIAAGVGVSVPSEQLLRSLVLTLLVPLILGKVKFYFLYLSYYFIFVSLPVFLFSLFIVRTKEILSFRTVSAYYRNVSYLSLSVAATLSNSQV